MTLTSYSARDAIINLWIWFYEAEISFTLAIRISEYKNCSFGVFKESCCAFCFTVCRGAVSAISHSHGSNISERYNMYKRQYTNCTHVLGNLAIQFLEEKDDYDMGFLKDIQEVSGFVLIIGNWFSHLNLTSLRVIRGMELFENKGNYSLYVALNYKKGSKTPVGLKELGLVSLQGGTRLKSLSTVMYTLTQSIYYDISYESWSEQVLNAAV